jgi:hypothetical protein
VPASAETAAPSGIFDPSLGCTAELDIRGATPWPIAPTAGDQYVCFGLTIPPSADPRQIIAIAPKVDNSTVVHHLIVYQSPTPVSSATTTCSPMPPVEWAVLFGWGPGGGPLTLPPQAGFKIEANQPAYYAVQIHYSNIAAEPGLYDQTSVGLCATNTIRPNDAAVMTIGSLNFTVPAQTKTSLACTLPVNRATPFQVFQVFPHLHGLGTSISAAVTHRDGSVESLVSVPHWVFSHQLSYPANVGVQNGDVITSQCNWTNTTTHNVNFGTTTADEMCFGLLIYYPVVVAPEWEGFAPAERTSCSQTSTPL